MKYIFAISLTMIYSLSILKGQEANIISLNFDQDTILRKIITLLPEDWNFSIKKDSLIFERNDTTWIINKYQSISNIKEITAEKNKRIKKDGEITKSRIILKYEPKWNCEKILSIKNCNTILSQEIQNLPEKYNIVQLYNDTISTRGNPVYTGITQKEKNQIAKYKKEKNELQSKIFPLPNYNSEKYSFFIVSLRGCNDNDYDVYPEEASLQLCRILGLFFEYANQ